MSGDSPHHPALTMLSEEERMFRDAIRDFSQSEIAPRAQAMEQAGTYDDGLLESLFEIGVGSYRVHILVVAGL